MLEIFQVITLISYCRSKLLSNLCPFLVFGWKNGAVVSTAASQPFSVEFMFMLPLGTPASFHDAKDCMLG